MVLFHPIWQSLYWPHKYTPNQRTLCAEIITGKIFYRRQKIQQDTQNIPQKYHIEFHLFIFLFQTKFGKINFQQISNNPAEPDWNQKPLHHRIRIVKFTYWYITLSLSNFNKYIQLTFHHNFFQSHPPSPVHN